MKVFCSILALIFSFNSIAQLVQSSCTVEPSVIKSYRNDADRLVLKHYRAKSYSEKDSVSINPMYSDTLLKALISVYNATDLIARDTVVEIFNIHSRWSFELNFLRLEADSGLAWMNELELNNIPTGYAPLDDFLIPYNIEILGYLSSNSNLHQVSFAADSNINIQAICNELSLLPGISFAEPGTDFIGLLEDSYYFPQSSNITADVKSDHVELNYTKTWGSGIRTWTFRAYYDCSVEYVGSQGSSVFVSDPEFSLDLTKVYPNPATNKVSIIGPFLFVNYTLIDVNGKLVKSGSVASNEDIFINELASGVYFLHLQSESDRKIIKMLKR